MVADALAMPLEQLCQGDCATQREQEQVECQE